jgi:hypothetical protein
MIEPHELRIGNWVYINGRGKKVGLDSFRIAKSKLAPIPLNQEWLINKFGFTEIKVFACEYFRKNFFDVMHKQGEGWFVVDEEIGQINSKPIQFVHELQNIYFCIEGEELTIESV